MSLAEVAAQLQTGKPRVSNYELAERGIKFEVMKQLDDLYGAGGALFDMAQSQGTPYALPARQRWVFHPETPRPVVAAHFGEVGPSGWVLLRSLPGTGRVDATLSWGPVAFDLSVPCDDRGVFVQVPAGAPPATIAVRLHAPGWVDQGRGPAPAHIGAPVLRLPDDPRLRVRATSLDPTEQAGVLSADTPCAATGPRCEGEDYAQLRERRCFILDDAAAWATALLPEAPVKVDTIRRLERGKDPRCRFLRSRLDVVYEAGGWATNETVGVHGARERFELEFPEFWVGPVWFELHSDGGAPAEVHLRQGRNRQAIRVVPGACVVDERRRRLAEPYVVTCPSGWKVRAGIGARPGAPAVGLARTLAPENLPLLPV